MGRRGTVPRVELLEAIQLLSGMGTNTQSASLPFQLIDGLSRPVSLAKFDPALGQLTSVKITVDSQVEGNALAQNLSDSTSSDNKVTVTFAGSFAFSGSGLATPLTDNGSVAPAPVPIGPFGGGSDTVLFGPDVLTVTNSASTTVTDTAQLAAFVGPGNLAYSFLPDSTSNASETEGNLRFVVSSKADADVTIVYTYATQSVSGYVYLDCPDNSGIRKPSDPGIAGVTVTLTGTNDLGPITPISMKTDANGFYEFPNLRAGTYTVTEIQPDGYLDGKETRGNVVPIPNSVGTDVIDQIVIGNGVSATNNNFGELTPGAIDGFVYQDTNENGLKDPGEPGIINVTMRLTGNNELGPITPIDVITDANGVYSFTNLRPGSYTITQVTPAMFQFENLPPGFYAPGLKTQGNITPIPGSTSQDFISAGLSPCSSLSNYNFGQLLPAGTITHCVDVSPRTFGIHAQPTTIALAFSDALDPAQATNLANYQLVSPGRDGKFGTRDDRTIPIRSATYDPATQTVILAPTARLQLGHFFQLTVIGTNGVVGTHDGLMNLNSQCANNFQTIFGRGNHFVFSDTDGDQIGLALRNGGLMEIYRSPDQGVQRIALYDALPYRNRLDATRSLLRGYVKRGRHGDGLAQIPLVVGINQVTNQLNDPPFVIGRTINRTTNPPAIGLGRPFAAHALRRQHA
ncbi:MAG: SdrD B-like domain-containing protein [Isosphaeraceae bacterium]